MDFIGTELKYRLTSLGEFSLNEHEWNLVFRVGAKKVTFEKRNTDDGEAWEITCSKPNMGVKPCPDGSWLALIDSAYFGEGRLIAELFAFIPDANFDPSPDFPTLDSVRTEVRRYSIETLTDL